MSTGLTDLVAKVDWKRTPNLVGALVLVTGLGLAGWIWHTQGGAAEEDLSKLGLALAPEDSAKYQRDVEVYYGKLGLLTDKWTRQLEALGHGKPLAELIGIGSLLASVACFFYGSVVKPPVGGAADAGGGPDKNQNSPGP
jgi:hypothetical protein